MERLVQLIGKERDVDEVARRLYQFVSDLHPPVVGALRVTCSDESERECIDAFQRSFCEYLLPSLKFGERSPFRIANLGGRYEWGAAAIAEQHFSTEQAQNGTKLLVVKVNAHVSVESAGGELHFGQMRRYDTDSVYCGALHALMEGAAGPFTADLHEALASEGLDRVDLLLDENRVDPAHRSLFAAVASARMQARRALVDIQDRKPQTPTIFVVLPCVTLNKPLKDGEIVCGIYHADWSADEPVIDYQGLGDDPTGYRLVYDRSHLAVEDDGMHVRRTARDHREMVVQQWLDAGGGTTLAEGVAEGEEHSEAEAQLDELLEEVAQEKHYSLDYAKPMLLMMLHSLAFLDPITALILLFGDGLVGMHHCHRAHRLSRNAGTDDEARSVLQEVRAKLESLDPERARRAIDFLHTHLKRRER